MPVADHVLLRPIRKRVQLLKSVCTGAVEWEDREIRSALLLFARSSGSVRRTCASRRASRS